MLREVQEAWKDDSSARARFQVSGATIRGPGDSNTMVVGSQFFTGKANIYCDGTADDVEILAAIDILSENHDGGIVHLSKGTYHISAALVLKDNIILEGEGAQTILEKNGAFDGVTATGGSGSELSNITIKDLKFTRNVADTNEQAFILFSYVDDSTIMNCFFDDCYYSAIIIDNSENNTISNNIVNGWRGIGIFVTANSNDTTIITNALTGGVPGSSLPPVAIVVQIASENCIIGENTIKNLTGGAGGVLAAYGVFAVSSHTVISGNTIDGITTSLGTAVGIYAAGNEVSIVNNIVRNITRTGATALVAGIWVFSPGCTISANIVAGVSSNSAGGYIAGIRVDDIKTEVSGNIVSNITRTVGAGPAAGISLFASSNGVSGNTIDTVTDHGIHIIEDDNRVDGNTITTCATGILIAATADSTIVNDNICLNNTTDFTDSGTNTFVG